ncbi:Leucine Rich repeats (2 copies) [compost metagenome]
MSNQPLSTSARSNADFIQANVPRWLQHTQRSALADILPAHPTVDNPDWWVNADPQVRQALLDSQARSHRSRRAAAKAFLDFKSIYAFCEPLLVAAIEQRFKVKVDVLKARFVHFAGEKLISERSLLAAALQNFSRATIEALANASVVIAEQTQAPYSNTLSIAPEPFARLCRELDLGAKYQAHLSAIFDTAQNRDTRASSKKAAARDIMEVAVHTAMLKKHISATGYAMLKRLLEQSRSTAADQPLTDKCGCFHLSVLGRALHDIVIIEFEEAATTTPCMVYMPGDGEQPIKEYPSLQAFYIEFKQRLKTPAFQAFITNRVTHQEQASFRAELGTSSLLGGADSWQMPRLRRELFDDLFRQAVQKIKDDARSLAIPVQDVDSVNNNTQSASVIATLGVATLGLGVFIPGMWFAAAAIFVMDIGLKLFHGADHWAVTDVETGLAFMRQIMLNAAIAEDGEEDEQLSPCALVDELMQVKLDDASVCLWHPALLPYAQDAGWKTERVPDSRGFYLVDFKTWVAIDDEIYQVEKDKTLGKWRIVHPRSADLFRPVLEHNGQGAWHHVLEQPERWGRATLVRRLGHLAQPYSDIEPAAAADLSGVTDAELRAVYRDDLPVPGVLLETWRRLAMDQQVSELIARIGRGELLPGDYAHVAGLLPLLPGWPKGKAIELYQSVEHFGQPLQTHGDKAEDVEPLKVAQPDLQGERLMKRVVAGLHPRERRDLTGEETDEPTLLRWLCDTLADRLSAARHRLFQTFYTDPEQAPLLRGHGANDEEIEQLRGLFPALPRPVAAELLRSASSRERARWQTLQSASLAFTERAVEAGRRVRLSQALSDFELSYLQNADTHRLALHLLEHLPGWAGRLRLEVRALTVTGRLVDSIGPIDATNVRILVQEGQRWSAYDGSFRMLGQPFDSRYAFFESLLQAVPVTMLSSLASPIDHHQDLRRRLRNLATAQPARARRILGMPGQRSGLASLLPQMAGRRGYPGASLIGSLFVRPRNIERLEALFVDDSPEELAVRLNRLPAASQAREQVISDLEQQFAQLNSALDTWVETDASNLLADGDIQYRVGFNQRQQVAALLRSTWQHRYIAQRVERLSSGGVRLRLSDLPLFDLPTLPITFQGVDVLELDNLPVTELPDGFLRAFPNLIHLSLNHSRIESLPQALGNLRRLQTLDLHGLAIGPGQLTPLRQLPSLTQLNLHLLPATPETWSVAQMAVLASIPGLRVLRITHSEASFEPGAFDAMTQLHTLSLRGNQITLTEATAGAWRHLTALTRLDLADNPLLRAPVVTGMTALAALNLDDTRITEWPEGLEELPAITSAVLTHNAITDAPPGAGRVPGLSMSRNAMTAAVRERVESEMAQVNNLERNTNLDEANPIDDPLEGADDAQQLRWDLVLSSPAAGSLLFGEMLISRGHFLVGGRRALLVRMQRVLEAMSESQALRYSVFATVQQLSENNYHPTRMFGVVEGIVEAERIIAENEEPLGRLIALGRRRGRRLALRRHVIARSDAWRRLNPALDADELSYFFIERLQQRLGIELPPGALHYPEYASGVTEHMLDAAEQAVLADDAENMTRWLVNEPYWCLYLYRGNSPQFEAIEQWRQEQLDYVQAMISQEPRPVLSAEASSRLAGILGVEESALASAMWNPDAGLDWADRINNLARAAIEDLYTTMTRQRLSTAPPA